MINSFVGGYKQKKKQLIEGICNFTSYNKNATHICIKQIALCHLGETWYGIAQT